MVVQFASQSQRDTETELRFTAIQWYRTEDIKLESETLPAAHKKARRCCTKDL